jgi:hypothetical protein
MFKKTLAAVAVGMLAFGAQAAEFTAADGTVFQVNFDAQGEFVQTKAAVGASTTFKGDGQFQMKATRKVNDDLSVFGQLEVDFDPVVDNGAVSADDMKIGLSSKTFGSIQIGQYDSYMEDNIAEALSYWNDAAADVKVTEGTVSNDGRQIQYLGKFGDFIGAIGINSSNASATGEQSIGTSFVLGYQANGLKVFVGQGNLPKYKSDTFAVNTVKSAVGGAIYYTFGNTTLSALGLKQTSTTDLDTNLAGLGIYHVMGDFDFGLALQNKVVNTSTTASTTTNEWTLHGGYTVSKGTKLYANMLSLGATDGVGDLATIGMKVSF